MARHVLCIDLGTSALKVAPWYRWRVKSWPRNKRHQVALLPGGGAEQNPRPG